ncbi:MAG TPA: TetR family transcriptional regulator [Polyangiaceae bacterium]|nr:TetR family transcriptional regulator [Polyangiaceae bacterium]
MRQQRPRGSTTRETVINAALQVVDRVGVDALTIRAVASAAGAPPMSLYTHFANKEELLDLMYAEMSRRMYADTGHDTWQAELLGLAQQVRQTLLAHPRWATLLSRPAPPLSVAARERVLSMMTTQGMPAADALRCFSTAMVVAIGLSLVELTFREPDGASSFARRFERLRTWFEQDSTSLEPTSREAFSAARHFDLGETFDLAMRTLVAGSELRGSTNRSD